MAAFARHAAGAAVAGAEALRGILDHRQASMARGDAVQGVHVADLAVQTDRHDGPGARRDQRLHLAGIHQAGVGLDVGEHRPGAQQHDHLGGRREGEGRGDDLVARPYAERHHGHQQGLGARGAGDAVPGAAAGFQRLLELAHLGPHDVLAVVQHTLDARVDIGFEGPVLGFQVDELHLARRVEVRHGGASESTGVQRPSRSW